MERGNRFNNQVSGSSAHRNISANKIKEIYIQNIANGNDTRPLQIAIIKLLKI